VKSAALAGPRAGWADARFGTAAPARRRYPSRVGTFCLVELQKLRHDRTELFTRAVQPVLWLLIFGETFNRLHAIPTGNLPYLDFLAPGIITQAGMFVAIFYGIQIIWERDAGVLNKLLDVPQRALARRPVLRRCRAAPRELDRAVRAGAACRRRTRCRREGGRT
jgi:ABC-2 type transport system permease protein